MGSAGNIVITSANSAMASMLIPRLKLKGYHTIGLIRRPAPVGTDEVITDWTNSAAAKKTLAEAHYIIHLSGDANAKNKASYFESNYSTTKIVADNVAQDRRQRIIYVSYANAGIQQKNLYLRYKAEAENLLQHTGKEVVIFRCPVIIDSPGKPSRMDELFFAKKGKAVPVIGNGRQEMHPVFRNDVVNSIVASLEKGSPGIYELSGPEEFTIDGFIQLVNRDPEVRIRHIPGWLMLILSRFIPALSPTFVDLMLHHSDSSYAPDTFRQFGIEPTFISRLWNNKPVPG